MLWTWGLVLFSIVGFESRIGTNCGVEIYYVNVYIQMYIYYIYILCIHIFVLWSFDNVMMRCMKKKA